MNREKAQFYDRDVPQWDNMFRYSPAPRVRREKIIAWLKERSISSLLDVGCGNGAFLAEIHRILPETLLYGADISKTTIEQNRISMAEAEFTLFDLNQDTLARQFDTVVCTEVVEHCGDYQATIQKLADMTENTLILTVPCGPLFEIDRRVGHVRHFKPEEITQAVENAGLTVTRCLAWGFPFFNLYKHLINLYPDRISDSFLSNKPYGIFKKLVSLVTYITFRFSLPWMGYQLFVTASRNVPAKPFEKSL